MNLHHNGEIILILGPMYSSKTTTLISKLERFKLAQKKVLLIKFSQDTRYTSDSENIIISHSKCKFVPDKTIYVNHLKDIDSDIIQQYNVIGIDEGQFFSDINLVNDWANNNHKIYISALNGTSDQKNFKLFEQIYPFVDSIIHLKAICMKCKNSEAPFTYKYNGDLSKEIDVGSSDKYISVCRDCLFELNNYNSLTPPNTVAIPSPAPKNIGIVDNQ